MANMLSEEDFTSFLEPDNDFPALETLGDDPPSLDTNMEGLDMGHLGLQASTGEPLRQSKRRIRGRNIELGTVDMDQMRLRLLNSTRRTLLSLLLPPRQPKKHVASQMTILDLEHAVLARAL